MSQKDLNPCNEPAPQEDINIDPPMPYCGDDGTPSQKRVPTSTDLSWLKENSLRETGFGQSGLCDPMQTGHIINDQGLEHVNPHTIYRYSKGIRGCDEGVMDLFRDIVVIDDQQKAHAVPIVWGSQEKAVTMMLQENVRKDNSLVVDRIKLPILGIYSDSFSPNQKRYFYHKAINYLRDNSQRPGWAIREKPESLFVDTIFGVAAGIPLDIGYTLYAWTLYETDIKQILQQVLLKFSPVAYIRISGVPWETIVKLDSIGNNVNIEPGDNTLRVIKFEFKLTVETYVPQPIVRRKNVLKTKTTMVDALEEENIIQVISRLEEAVKELDDRN